MGITESGLLNHCIGDINACCLASYILNEVKDYYNYYPINKDFKKDTLEVQIVYNNIGENLKVDNNKKELVIVFNESSDVNNTVFAFLLRLVAKKCITDNEYIYSNEYSNG